MAPPSSDLLRRPPSPSGRRTLPWGGIWEAEDAPKAGVPHWLLIPVMFGTFMYGPAGLLAYLVVRVAISRMKPKAA